MFLPFLALVVAVGFYDPLPILLLPGMVCKRQTCLHIPSSVGTSWVSGGKSSTEGQLRLQRWYLGQCV